MKNFRYLWIAALILLIILVVLRAPFIDETAGGFWAKASTHTHTQNSDGSNIPSDVVTKYENMGYDVLALTDHNYITPCSTPYTIPHTFLCVDSYEWSGKQHLALIRVMSVISTNASVQAALDASASDGGVAILNHPTRVPVEQVLSYTNLTAMEIYNGKRNEYYVALWDSALTNGSMVLGIAGDDAHNISRDAGRGWYHVYLETLTPEDYVLSVKMGHFYSSQGPTMDEQPFELNCDGITVTMGGTARCTSEVLEATVSPSTPSEKVQHIDLVKNGRILYSKTDCPAQGDCSFTYSEQASGWGYYRLQAQDSLGKWIWSNPIWINEN